jgi:Ca2+-binding RTX toxin-like protein
VTVFVDYPSCERVVRAAGAAERTSDATVVDRASNRGRRLGGEAAVARGTPATLGYNRATGGVLNDRMIVTSTSQGGSSMPSILTKRLAYDEFTLVTLVPAAIAGLTDRDLLSGRGGDDVLDGGGGNDHLEGEDGNDALHGRDGDDLLYGRKGDDVVRGGSGDDVLEGGRGRDVLKGEAGDDELNGGIDPDRLYGGAGADRLVAVGGGVDVVDCGPGRDVAVTDRRDRVSGCERIQRRG